MKKLLALISLLTLPFLSRGQYGTAQFNNFGIPIYPHNFSRFWLNGSIPFGTNPIMEFHGLYKLNIYSDSINIPKLSLAENPNPFKLVWIGQDSVLKAFTPNYVRFSDTTTILSPYIRALEVSQIYYPITNPAGYLTSSDISGKLNISDTSSMLSSYIRKIDTTNNWAFKANYLLSETDPISLHISDTNLALSPYLRKIDTTLKWQFIGSYLFTSDTANMLTNYQRKAGVRRVETYLGTTDGSGNYTVTYSSSFPITPDVQPQLQAGTTSQIVRITSSTTTGFTVNVTNRASVTLLGIEVLLAATTPVSGSSVGVLVTAR